jgi:hypothetical protein
VSGTLAIPKDFTTEATDSIGNFMANWFAIRDYINPRELTVGLLANRPAAGNNGASYLATDVTGGTLYLDNGSVWTPAAAGVSVSIPSFTVPLPYVPITF